MEINSQAGQKMEGKNKLKKNIKNIKVKLG
jgi:hypothetical protein